jgi:hypothetical protein
VVGLERVEGQQEHVYFERQEGEEEEEEEEDLFTINR